MIQSKVEVFVIGIQVNNMMDNGKIIRCMEKVHLHGLTVKVILVNFRTINLMVTGNLNGLIK